MTLVFKRFGDVGIPPHLIDEVQAFHGRPLAFPYSCRVMASGRSSCAPCAHVLLMTCPGSVCSFDLVEVADRSVFRDKPVMPRLSWWMHRELVDFTRVIDPRSLMKRWMRHVSVSGCSFLAVNGRCLGSFGRRSEVLGGAT